MMVNDQLSWNYEKDSSPSKNVMEKGLKFRQDMHTPHPQKDLFKEFKVIVRVPY